MRRAVSLILLFGLIMMPVSAIIVHAGHGTVAGHQWLHVHGLTGIVFCAAGLAHVAYNWRVLQNHFKCFFNKK